MACEKKIKTSKDAHRMFYEAMLADGTSEARALLFYTAVRLFGPQWEAVTGPTNRQFKMTLASKVTEPKINFKRLEAALDQALKG
ncbi:MAG: hypothetical protein WCA63_05825 [Gallionella sp.]